MSSPVRETPHSSIAAAISTLERVWQEADREVSTAREDLTRAILKRAKADVGLMALGVVLDSDRRGTETG